jgi:predicted amidohydrolase
MATAGGGRWTIELTERLAELDGPSREDLFVLLLTWLCRHQTRVKRSLRTLGLQMPLVEPTPDATPAAVMAALVTAAAQGTDQLARAAVATTRALDQELAETSVRLLRGEHLGIDGSLFRVRPRITPAGIPALYGATKDDPAIGVARRMSCVPMGLVGDLLVIDATPLPGPTRTRLERRRQAGKLRVLVDAIRPDPGQWIVDGPWTSVQRRHDDEMIDVLAGAVDAAASMAADLLILPELALAPESVDHLAALLRELRRPHPVLVAFGVTHQPSDATPLVVNEAVVLDGRGGELLRHRKLVAFSSADPSGVLVEERIEPGQTLGVLATPVGNMSLLICKDLFSERPEPALQLGYVTWLVVPSLSRSTGPHRDRARQLRSRLITTVSCNTWYPEEQRRAAGPHVAAGPTLPPATGSGRQWLVDVHV